MIVLAFIGSLAILFGVFYAGLKLGAHHASTYMVEICALAAKRAGYDPVRFENALGDAEVDYKRGKRA